MRGRLLYLPKGHSCALQGLALLQLETTICSGIQLIVAIFIQCEDTPFIVTDQ